MAYDSSDARFVPMLVEALKEIQKSGECHEEWFRTIAKQALAQLPQEYL